MDQECMAIYYFGPHPAYKKISGTQTPIYIGKADPRSSEAKTSREQGPQLYGRIKDHQKAIGTVEKYALDHGDPLALRLDDFQYCRLVVATNAQLTAERYLILLFEPIWNEETKICWGISKHGDLATTCSNDRSPWDVLHPGRKWAMSNILKDKKSRDQILVEIDGHLTESPPFTDRQQIIERFLDGFKQHVELQTPKEAMHMNPRIRTRILWPRVRCTSPNLLPHTKSAMLEVDGFGFVHLSSVGEQRDARQVKKLPDHISRLRSHRPAG